MLRCQTKASEHYLSLMLMNWVHFVYFFKIAKSSYVFNSENIQLH